MPEERTGPTLERQDAALEANLDLARESAQDDGGERAMARELVRRRLFGPADDAPFRFGRYVVLETLGAGGTGIVHAAYDPELDRRVALKILRAESDPKRRLLHEARTLAKLSHPNVLAVFDVGTVELVIDGVATPRDYVAMELVEGGTLGRWMARGGHTIAETLATFGQAARGLAAAHALGIVHRDFKPDNALVDASGRVHVMDFGLASRVREDSSQPTGGGASLDLGTLDGRIAGTPSYMAPEQFLGESVDARADQFAFCVALYEALCGQRPFAGDSLAALADNVIAGRVREFPRDAAIPIALRRTVLRGLSTAPEDRFASMDDLLVALDRRARGRRTALASVAIVAVVGGALVVREARRAMIRRECSERSAELAEIWNPDVRTRVRDAMVATGSVFAATSAERASEWIDVRTQAWSREREAACLEARIEHVLDEPAAARSETCFADRRAELAELLDLFVQADATTVRRAATAAARLPDAHRCRDPSWLARRPLASHGDDEAPREIRRRIARSTELAAVARYADALAEARTALDLAKGHGDPVVEAAAELAVGRAAELGGDPELARTTLETAAHRAGAEGADELAAECTELLVWVAGVLQAKPEVGLAWAQAAATWHDRLELAPDDPHRIVLLVHTSSVYEHAGRYDEALTAGERALVMKEAQLGSQHPDIAVLLSNLAMVHGQRGEREIAIELGRRALAIREDALGPDHPDVAISLNNLGIEHYNAKQYAYARAEHERALAIRRAVWGEDHPEVALSLTNLGHVVHAEGRIDEAAALYREAAAIGRRLWPQGHPDMVPTLNALGVIARGAGDLEDAEARAREAVTIYEAAFGPQHPRLATLLGTLAEVMADRGRPEESLALRERGLQLRQRANGPDDPRTAFDLVGIGRAHTMLGHPERAVPLLERALELHVKGDHRPEDVALARLRLAEALAEIADSGTRARELAWLALAGLAGPGADMARARAQAFGWLAQHSDRSD